MLRQYHHHQKQHQYEQHIQQLQYKDKQHHYFLREQRQFEFSEQHHHAYYAQPQLFHPHYHQERQHLHHHQHQPQYHQYSFHYGSPDSSISYHREPPPLPQHVMYIQDSRPWTSKSSSRYDGSWPRAGSTIWSQFFTSSTSHTYRSNVTNYMGMG